MRSVIAAINMTLDGFCDHTAIIPDEEIHQHYADLLKGAGTLLYGRITYQLMESFWPTLLEKPSGDKSMDDFAIAIDRVPKIVFSNSIKSTDPTMGWKTAELATRGIKEEVLELKQRPGKEIFVGSRSLIVSLLNLGLVDELQLCIHPVVAAAGLPLFDKMNERVVFKLSKTKTFGSGAVIHYLHPVSS